MNRRSFLVGSTIIAGSIGLGGVYWRQRWKYIVVHHSAGSYGNIEFLQKVHRQRQPSDPIDAIPYHYIIGNGNGLGLGQIDSNWREQYDIWGSHVSSADSDHNFRGLGICLIGNFERHKVPARQYDSLVILTKKLMKTYKITPHHVTGHGYLKGQSTKCPGKYFPMNKFKQNIT